jgi:hypothetical protein
MSWLLVVPLVTFAAVVLLAPGAGLGWAIGLRGPSVLLVAPAATVSMIGLAAIVLAWLHIPWSLGTFLVAAGVAVLLAVAVRVLLERRTGPLQLRLGGFRLPAFGWGLVLWSALIAYPMVRLFRNAGSIIQSFDNVFHLNSVQYILDTGQASSLTIASLTAPGGPVGFYPAAWHGFVALILGTARSVNPALGIGVAVNAATVAVLVLGWAAGCLFLTQVLAGGRTAVSLLTAAVLGSLYAFPWIFLPEGGLYPNLLGNSLLVGAVAWLYLLMRPGSADESERASLVSSTPLLLGSVVVAVQLPGIALSHPNSVFLLAAFGLAIAWARWQVPRNAGARSRRGLLALIAASAAFVAAWILLAPARPTAAREPVGLAITAWELIQGAVSDGGRAAPTLSLLVLAGLVVAVRRREPAGLMITAFAGVVYLLALGGPTAAVSRLAGGLLYNDSERIAAFAVLAALPLVIGALNAAVVAAGRLAERLAPMAVAALRSGILLGLAILLAVPLQLWSLSPMISQSSTKLVVLGERTRRMSRDEYTLISRMRELVPSGEKVIADPATGGGFIYALTGVPLVFPHAFLVDTPAMRQLRSQMFNPEQLAATCAAMDTLGAHYFYDPGRYIFHASEGPDAFPGLDEPNPAMLTAVAGEGSARLYRFSACDR